MFRDARTAALCAAFSMSMTFAAAAADKIGMLPSAGEAAATAALAASATDAVQRATDFTWLCQKPEKPGGRTLILLHGSGGNEKTLMELAAKIAPNATLVGVRGRLVQAGTTRWYKRLSPTSFDQADIRAEADAFAVSLHAASREYGFSLENAVFLGYSNGANLIGALSVLHPGLVHRAALLRAMPVLEQAPDVALSGADILTIAGKADATYSPFAPALENMFRKRGARVKAHMIDANHMIGDEDARLVREWLTASLDPAGSAAGKALAGDIGAR
ncbi:MAG: alpha/beta hydrolase [Rhizobiaceae bacterium]|nr:alpha/beta hydrolase [Rhizobiaceae bacterium]